MRGSRRGMSSPQLDHCRFEPERDGAEVAGKTGPAGKRYGHRGSARGACLLMPPTLPGLARYGAGEMLRPGSHLARASDPTGTLSRDRGD